MKWGGEIQAVLSILQCHRHQYCGRQKDKEVIIVARVHDDIVIIAVER